MFERTHYTEVYALDCRYAGVKLGWGYVGRHIVGVLVLSVALDSGELVRRRIAWWALARAWAATKLLPYLGDAMDDSVRSYSVVRRGLGCSAERRCQRQIAEVSWTRKVKYAQDERLDLPPTACTRAHALMVH